MKYDPPIGTTFESDVEAPLDAVIQAANHILAFLQAQNIAPIGLCRYDDWFEHDGLHFRGTKIEFSDAFGLFQTPMSLFEATPDEDLVCIGIAPESNDWYLRARAHWNFEGTSVVGMISITMIPDLADRFRESRSIQGAQILSEEESQAYFNRISV